MSKIVTLQGMRYKAHSPSLFELEGFPVVVTMGVDRRWYVWSEEDLEKKGFKVGAKTFDTRDAAAAIVNDAFKQAGTG